MARAARVLRPVCPRWHQTRAHRPRDSGRDSVRTCACRSTLARWAHAQQKQDGIAVDLPAGLGFVERPRTESRARALRRSHLAPNRRCAQAVPTRLPCLAAPRRLGKRPWDGHYGSPFGRALGHYLCRRAPTFALARLGPASGGALSGPGRLPIRISVRRRPAGLLPPDVDELGPSPVHRRVAADRAVTADRSVLRDCLPRRVARRPLPRAFA